ncbi:MAG TPA: hypothetical protein VKR58_10490 [Aquella sp.]|nr:hypothetical protein [Aquella sp.]
MPGRTKSRARYHSSPESSFTQIVVQHISSNQSHLRQPDSINLVITAAGKRYHGWATPSSLELQPGIPAFFTIVLWNFLYFTQYYSDARWVGEPPENCQQEVLDKIGDVLMAWYE